jgi:GntR family transcriptional regulator
MIHATEKLKAALADEAAAASLGVAVGTPVLSIERVAFTYGERPVELRRAVYLTVGHHYHNELS